MKRVPLLTYFLLAVLIIVTGCRKERLLTKGQDIATTSGDDKNSSENLDGDWVVLEKEKIQSYVSTGDGDVEYFPKEVFDGDPYSLDAEIYTVTGEKYNEVGVTLQVKGSSGSDVDYRLDDFENDSEDLDPDYRYFIWLTRINPELGKDGRLKLGKREDD